MKHDYYYGGAEGVFEVKKACCRRPKNGRFPLDLSMIERSPEGRILGITYPRLHFTAEEFPADKLCAFMLGAHKRLRVVDEREDKANLTQEESDALIKNYLYSDGELRAVLSGPFAYVGKHSTGEDPDTSLIESIEYADSVLPESQEDNETT